MVQLFFRGLGYFLLAAALTIFGGLCGFQRGGTIGAAIGGGIAWVAACLVVAYLNNLEAANSR